MFRSESPPRAPSCGSLRLDAIVSLSLLTKYRNFTDIVVQPMRILYNIGCRVGYAILALTLCYLTTLFNDARQITIVTKFPASTLPAGESVCASLSVDLVPCALRIRHVRLPSVHLCRPLSLVAVTARRALIYGDSSIDTDQHGHGFAAAVRWRG